MAEPTEVLRAWDPKRGAEVQAKPEELAAKFLRGDAQLLEGQEYPLIGPDGQVWDVPAAGVSDALHHGYNFATKSDVVKADAPDQNLQAFAEAALDGATFGTGGAILTQLGADPEAVSARAAANPVLRTLGVGVGATAAAAATGGGVGALAARGAARIAATAGITGRAAAAVGGAAAGAVEGGLYGAGSAVSEAALGRTDLVAERMLAAAGAGSFWGAATGGPLGAMLGKTRPRDADIEAVYAAATGNEPAKGLGKLFRAGQDRLRVARAAAAKAGGASPEFVEGAFGKDSARWMDLATGPQEEVDALTRELTDRLSKHLAVSERVHSFGARVVDDLPSPPGAVAPEPVIQNIDPLADPALRAQADRAAERARALHGKEVDAFKADLRGKSAAEWAAKQPELETLQARLDADIEAAVAPIRAKGAERAGRAAARAEDAAVREVARIEAAGQRQFRQAARGVRAEADPLAAARQRVVEEFRSGLTHVDPSKVGQFVNSITRPRSDARLAALREYRAQLQVAAQGADDATRQAVAAADAGLEVTMGAIEERVVARNQWREQLQREQQQAVGAMGGRAVGAAAGAAFGGPVGAAVGLLGAEVVENVARPAHALLRRSAQRRTLEGVSQYARAGARAFASRRGRAIDAVPMPVRAGLPRAVAPTTVELLKDDGDPQALRARAEELHAAALQPTATSARLAALASDDLPAASDVISVRLMELNEWLRARLPEPVVPGVRPLYAADAVRQFARMDAAAQDPLRVVDQLASGELPSSAEVEVVRQFYPSVLEDFQTELADMMVDDPDALDWEQTVRLGVALGLATHPALRPEAIAQAQQVAAQAVTGQQPTPGRSPKPPKQERGDVAGTNLDSLQEQP